MKKNCLICLYSFKGKCFYKDNKNGLCKKNCQYFKKDKAKEAVKLLNSVFGTKAVKKE